MLFQSRLPEKQPGQFFVIQAKIGSRTYYLVDLGLTLSRNICDSMIILDEKTANYLERVTEGQLEQGLGVPVTCYAEAVPNDVIT